MASRDLDSLHAEFKARARVVLSACKVKGVDLLVTCTFRTMEEQKQLYAQGRTSPGRIVTNAKPGQSAHNYGMAMDVVPLRNGKAVWDIDDPEWQVYGEEVRKAGLEWAGDWKTFKEYPHCQLKDWKTVVKSYNQE